MTNSDHQEAVSTVERTVSATVIEATIAKRGDEEHWRLKLQVPWSNYPIPTSIPREWAQQVLGGETHVIKMRRGRIICVVINFLDHLNDTAIVCRRVEGSRVRRTRL